VVGWGEKEETAVVGAGLEEQEGKAVVLEGLVAMAEDG
jgi:hypothetical protein